MMIINKYLLTKSIPSSISIFFFLNDTATTEIYPLPLHDALPIYALWTEPNSQAEIEVAASRIVMTQGTELDIATLKDRKSTRLNSSHGYISYAVFCLKKKKNNTQP